MKCRLKVNTVLNGRFVERGTVVDDSEVPAHFKTEGYVTDVMDTEGRVLLLRDLSFQSLPRSSASGIPTSFPTHVARGELFDLAQVTASKRQSLVEGLDYKSSWTHQDLEEMRREQEDIYAKQLETETEVPAWINI